METPSYKELEKKAIELEVDRRLLQTAREDTVAHLIRLRNEACRKVKDIDKLVHLLGYNPPPAMDLPDEMFEPVDMIPKLREKVRVETEPKP